MSTFRASYEGIGELIRSAGMQAAMHAKAEKVAARAEATAPVESGEYKSAFSVSSGVQHKETSRAYGRVTNDSPHAFYVEYGTSDTPRFRILGKALDAAKE